GEHGSAHDAGGRSGHGDSWDGRRHGCPVTLGSPGDGGTNDDPPGGRDCVSIRTNARGRRRGPTTAWSSAPLRGWGWSYLLRPCMISRMRSAVADGVLPTLTPAASRASFLAAAVPEEPETMAPAWPIVLPSGAVKPAT